MFQCNISSRKIECIGRNCLTLCKSERNNRKFTYVLCTLILSFNFTKSDKFGMRKSSWKELGENELKFNSYCSFSVNHKNCSIILKYLQSCRWCQSCLRKIISKNVTNCTMETVRKLHRVEYECFKKTFAIKSNWQIKSPSTNCFVSCSALKHN